MLTVLAVRACVRACAMHVYLHTCKVVPTCCSALNFAITDGFMAIWCMALARELDVVSYPASKRVNNANTAVSMVPVCSNFQCHKITQLCSGLFNEGAHRTVGGSA